MGNYARCSTCQEFCWLRSHKCPPKWRVRDEESGGDYIDYEVFAADEEDAAEKAVAKDFWEDPSDHLPDGVVMLVESVAGGDPVRVSVTGEPDVHWSSSVLRKADR